MFDSKHLHIAVASDENYARFVATLIVSTAKNNTDFEKITFHLLSNGISKDTLEKIQGVIDAFENCEIRTYDISDLHGRLKVDVPHTIALTSYARLFMREVIPDDVSKILYLDTDIIVTGKLQQLWDTELDDNYLGGCLDIFEGTVSKTAVGLALDSPYINAGVLLINLDLWGEDSLSSKFLDFLCSHDGNVHHHDQGIVNGVCRDRMLILPPQYNLHSPVFSHSFSIIRKISNPHYTAKEYEDAIANPVIIHFTEGFYNRPWKKHCKHPMKNIFVDIQNETPWRGVPLQPDNRSVATKALSFSFLNFPYFIYRIVASFMRLLSAAKKQFKF